MLGHLNPFNRHKRGKSSSLASGAKARARKLFDWLKPFKRKKDPKNKAQRKQTNPSPWTEMPLHPKNNNGTEWKDRTMVAGRRRVTAPSAGGGTGSGGGLTAAGQQFAAALAKPPTEVSTLKTFDRDLGDLAGAIEAIQGGLKNHAAVVQAGMPDETAAHEDLGRYTQQLGQMAEGLKLLQADQRRRNALDHQRVDDGRKNERGYDWQSNQE